MRIFSGLEACVMQSAETVVEILRARGRRGLYYSCCFTLSARVLLVP